MITLKRDNNNIPLPIVHLGENQVLDGSSAHAESTVISEDNEVVVRLACAEPIFFAIGEDPAAGEDDGIILVGDIVFPLPAGQVVSVYGGVASLTVLG
ncbi:MAG: hypothetical protein PHC50_04370 [Candidatus Cloacimonetes bacterium]|nr:hypothetical protein [Candidatus Cloacimonadota bacterium]